MSDLKVVAHIGGNFVTNTGKSVVRALTLIDEARQAGATDVRIDIINPHSFHVSQEVSDSLIPFELSFDEVEELVAHAQTSDIGVQLTPHFLEAVDWISVLECDIYITSGDITNTPLLNKIANLKNPPKVYLATGASHLYEVEDAIEVLTRGGEGNVSDDSITLIHTTAALCGVQGLNLNRIAELQAEFFPLQVGYADMALTPAITSSVPLYGVDHIEINFDLGDCRGADRAISYTQDELRTLIDSAEAVVAARSCGCSDFPITDLILRHTERRNPINWLRPAGADLQEGN